MDSPSTLARPHPQASPRWLAVANVIFAGIAAALHVGKATIALPSLQRSFGGDLAALSWIMSAFRSSAYSAASPPASWCVVGEIAGC